MRLPEWILVFAAQILFSQGEKCGGLAREEAGHTLTCTLNSLDQGIIWQLQEKRGFVNISTCGSSGSCSDLYPSQFQASRKSVPAQTGTASYKGQLTVISANRTQTIFRCIKSGNPQPEICELKVYVTPDKPKCQAPNVTKIGSLNYLQVTCSSERIYPMGKCDFKHKGIPNDTASHITISSGTSSQNPGDYRIECTWTAQVLNFTPGLFTAQVEVYPELGDEWVEASSVYGEWTPATTLSIPTVSLAKNCPDGPSVKNGYIMANTEATCKCELTSQGFPPGYAQWFRENGDKVGAVDGNGSASLKLVYGSTDPKYVCRPETSLKVLAPSEVTYSPQYAVGPEALTIDMSDTFPLCPSENRTFRITCKTPAKNVVPKPLFTIVIENKIEAENKQGLFDSVSQNYYWTHLFRPDFGGLLRIYCKTTNEIFSTLFYEFERPLNIDDPPRLPPVFKASDNQPETGSNTVYVAERGDISLTCRVDGGFPKVSNVTIVCGANKNTMQGTLATISVRIPDGTKQLLCHCSAWHVSKCYDKQTEVVLKLREPGSPDGSTSQTSNIDLSLGLGVGLGCLIIILVIVISAVIIVFKKKEKQIKKKQDVQYSEPTISPSSPGYQYMPFVPGRSGPPRVPLPSLPDQSDYDLITLDADAVHTSSANGSAMRNESVTDPLEGNFAENGYIQPI